MTCWGCQVLFHWEYICFLGTHFPGMKGLILVLMLNVCYLAIILIFLVVTWWLLLITWWLLLVTGSYCLWPLVAASSHFQYEHKIVPLMNTYISFLWALGKKETFFCAILGKTCCFLCKQSCWQIDLPGHLQEPNCAGLIDKLGQSGQRWSKPHR